MAFTMDAPEDRQLAAYRRRRQFKDRLFAGLCLTSTVLAVLALLALLIKIFSEGMARLSPKFLQNFPSIMFPQNAGIKGALVGSLYIVVLTGLMAVPIGVAAAIYLEEFTVRKNRFTDFIQVNIANLSGVPSIVYGLLGFAVFVSYAHMGKSLIAGASTMALLILPPIILISQEALKAVPRSFREGSYALGATKWQTIRRQVLPAALPGILTGVILSLSRAIGETAPLIVVGAVGFNLTLPKGIGDSYTVLPIQIWNWSSYSTPVFRELAASGIIVLMVVLLALNSIAILLRYRSQKSA